MSAETPPVAPAAPPMSLGRRRLVLSALLLATVLASLDSSFVPIAFPDIIDKLDQLTMLLEASFDTHPELPLDADQP